MIERGFGFVSSKESRLVGEKNGRKRGRGEYGCVFYKKDKLVCVNEGLIQMEENREEAAESITLSLEKKRGEKSERWRMPYLVKFVTLEKKEREKVFGLLCLHLSPSSPQNRELEVQRVKEYVGREELKEVPIIICGDFNTNNKKEHDSLFATFKDTQQMYSSLHSHSIPPLLSLPPNTNPNNSNNNLPKYSSHIWFPRKHFVCEKVATQTLISKLCWLSFLSNQSNNNNTSSPIIPKQVPLSLLLHFTNSPLPLPSHFASPSHIQEEVKPELGFGEKKEKGESVEREKEKGWGNSLLLWKENKLYLPLTQTNLDMLSLLKKSGVSFTFTELKQERVIVVSEIQKTQFFSVASIISLSVLQQNNFFLTSPSNLLNRQFSETLLSFQQQFLLQQQLEQLQQKSLKLEQQNKLKEQNVSLLEKQADEMKRKVENSFAETEKYKLLLSERELAIAEKEKRISQLEKTLQEYQQNQQNQQNHPKQLEVRSTQEKESKEEEREKREGEKVVGSGSLHVEIVSPLHKKGNEKVTQQQIVPRQQQQQQFNNQTSSGNEVNSSPLPNNPTNKTTKVKEEKKKEVKAKKANKQKKKKKNDAKLKVCEICGSYRLLEDRECTTCLQKLNSLQTQNDEKEQVSSMAPHHIAPRNRNLHNKDNPSQKGSNKVKDSNKEQSQTKQQKQQQKQKQQQIVKEVPRKEMFDVYSEDKTTSNTKSKQLAPSNQTNSNQTNSNNLPTCLTADWTGEDI